MCKSNCVVEKSFGSVIIGTVETHIAETAWASGWVRPPFPAHGESSRSADVVGARPAVLAAAERLRRRGHAIEILNRHDRPGGLHVLRDPPL